MRNRISKGTVLYVSQGRVLPEYFRYEISEEGYSVMSLMVYQFIPRPIVELTRFFACVIEMDISHSVELLSRTETNNGKETGKVIYQIIRQTLPTVPVIMLLDSDQDSTLLPDDQNLVCIDKMSSTPSGIWESIKNLCAKSKTPPQ